MMLFGHGDILKPASHYLERPWGIVYVAVSFRIFFLFGDLTSRRI